MNIIEALHNEETKLQHQLTAVQSAIAALKGSDKTAVSLDRASKLKATSGKRTMSAATKAKIRRSARARWAKIRAEENKGKKAK